MTFWVSIIILCIVTFIFCVIYCRKSSSDVFIIGAIASGVLTFIIGLTVLVCWMEYINFENSFAIQQDFYQEIIESDSPLNDVYLTADIINANQELTKFQASKKIYGPFTVVPDRVLDITPIGINS